jgi:predicted DNA-binding transcriptional regulator AlpA
VAEYFREDISERVRVLTRHQVAQALGISVDTLDALHAANDGPPRFRASPRRWSYPIEDFRNWQRARMAKLAAKPNEAA